MKAGAGGTTVCTVVIVSLLSLSGVDSQTVVQEPSSVSVALGGTVTMTCSLSSGLATKGRNPGWFQQTPGQVPHQIIYSTNSRPSGVPGRFSGSVSEDNAVLTITGVQAEDEADYFCVLEVGSYIAHSDTNPWGSVTKTNSHTARTLSP